MSNQTRTLNNATDAYVTSRRPELNKSTQARLKVSAGGDGNTQQIFIFFSLPFPKGANVQDGHFRVTSAASVGTSVTLTVARVTEKWNAGKVRWNKRPAVTSTHSVSVTKVSSADGTVWDFDIGDILDDVSSSGQWWGLRIVSTADAPVTLYSAQAGSSNRPELEVTWGDEPEPPEDLSPAGGRAVSVNKPILSFTFTDESGSTELNAVQIHYKATNTGFSSLTGFSSPAWDSGTIFTSDPQVDTFPIAGAPTITAGSVMWWTARVQDASGQWSEYADPESFTYQPLTSATLDNPPVGGVVNDATPPVLWTMANQTAYKVLLAKASDPNTLVWNSGKISTTDDDTAIPPKKILYDGADYILDLYLWDNYNREKNGTNELFTHIQRTFQFQASGSVSVVTGLAVAQQTPWPWVNITFSRSTAPDEFNIFRDDVLIDSNVPASELSTGGTSYTYQDRLANPREAHTWSVQAVVNKVSSNKVTSSALTTRLIAPFMMELDGTNPVFFLNPGLDPQLLTLQEVQQPVNSDPVLLTQFLGGYTGHLAGVFVDNIVSGLSARQMRNTFKRWKKNPGDTYILYMVDEVLTIVPYNMTYKPRAVSGGVLYDVEFDFFEVD